VSKVTLIGPICQLGQHAILNVNTRTYTRSGMLWLFLARRHGRHDGHEPCHAPLLLWCLGNMLQK